MTLKLLRVTALAVFAFALFVDTSAAQQSVSVSVAATQSGVVTEGCLPGAPLVTTPAVFTLTRIGDVSDGLTVSIAWSGDLSLGTTVSPTTVAFAPGSSTATVTPMFTMVPQSAGELILTVMAGAGYEPGRPPTTSTTFSTIAPSCPAVPGPPLANTPPPPVQLTPTLTG